MKNKIVNKEIERRVYNNGLVAIADIHPGFEKTQVVIGIKSGSGDDSVGKEGTAHLLEHMKFKSNQDEFGDSLRIDAAVNGIKIDGKTNPLQTIYELNGFSQYMPKILKLGARMLEARDYSQKDYKNERDGVIRTELAMKERNPLVRFKRNILMPILFNGTTLGRPVLGTADSLESISLEDMFLFENKFYVPNNMVIVVSGGFEKEKFFDIIDKTFGKLKPKNVVKANQDLEFLGGNNFIEFPDLKDPNDDRLDLSFVYLGFRINPLTHKDSLALRLLRTHFTNGGSSEVFKQLREKKGIGYQRESSYLTIDDKNSIYYFGIPGVHPTKVEETINGLRKMVKISSKELIDIKTLRSRKVQLAMDYKKDFSPGRIANNLFDYEILRPYYSNFRDIVHDLKLLSRKKVQDVAQRNFSDEPAVIVASPPGYKF